MMKIMAVTNINGTGGAQLSLMRLVDGLRARHHDVSLWFMASDHNEKMPPNANVLLHEHVAPGTHSPRIAIWLIRRLYMELKAANPDVVISFLPRSNVLTQGLAWWLGVPCRIASQRNPRSQASDSRINGWVLGFLDYMLCIWGGYTHNVMISDAVLNSYSRSRLYRRRCSVIYNGVDCRQSMRDAVQARRMLGLPEKGMIIGHAGRLHKQKDQKTLIAAMKDLPGAHLAIAGDGPLRSDLESLVAKSSLINQVYMLGRLDTNSMAEFYRAIDIFAMPSLYEGLCNAVVEALHANVPIVASRIPVFEEILEPKGGPCAGLLVPVANVSAWSHTLAKVLQSAAIRSSLKTAAAVRAELFTMESMIDQFEQLMLSSALEDATDAK